MKEIPIGVDNGFGNTKGCNSIIQSGVRKLSTKPPLETHVVEYNGEYYAVSCQKMDIQKS